MIDIKGYHHLTACVAGAQEDVDFYVHVLGQRLVKKTVLLDGTQPIYHLYYGNPDGDPGTIVTSFPYRQKGVKGRRGSGQIKTINYSVPAGSLPFWRGRFARYRIAQGEQFLERFGQQRLRFTHPCGFELELVASNGDGRAPWQSQDIPIEYAIRGVHSVTCSLRDIDESVIFMADAMGFAHLLQEGPHHRFALGTATGAGQVIEFLHEPDLPQGSSIYGEGTVHHVAFAVDDTAQQMVLREHLMSLGYIDVSDSVDRNYFRSMYFRMPGGVIFEAATTDIGLAKDEPRDVLGREFQLPPNLVPRRDALLAALEPIHI
jgi:glyoxalase family protein